MLNSILKILSATSIAILLPQVSLANCEDSYIERIALLGEKAKQLSKSETIDTAFTFGGATTGLGLGGLTVAAAPGLGWFGLTTGTISGLVLGKEVEKLVSKEHYDNMRELPEVVSQIKATATALALIKESILGDGEVLQVTVYELMKAGRTQLSIGQFANAVKKLNQRNMFCKGDSLDSPKEIVTKTLEEIGD